MPLRTPDAFLGHFRERDTPTLRASIVDDSVPAVAIPGSALTTATLTIYDEHGDHDIVNERDGVNVKPNIDENGALEFTLEEEDMVILRPSRKTERRRFLIVWTWDSPEKRGSWEGQLVIENVLKVGSPA